MKNTGEVQSIHRVVKSKLGPRMRADRTTNVFFGLWIAIPTLKLIGALTGPTA
jgi:hypothetical protein